MYDEIDIKHVARINFAGGSVFGFIIGFVSLPIILGILEYFGNLDKALDFFGFK